MIKTIPAIYECVAEVDIPTGQYDGTWEKNVIKFNVPEHPPCEIYTPEEIKKPKEVMVIVLEKLILVHDQNDLK